MCCRGGGSGSEQQRAEGGHHVLGWVVGRKNYLFAGSEGGAESAATWCSLIGSCMLNAIDPWLYLNDVLPRLGDWPVNRVLELEPVAWRIRRLSEAR